MITVLIFVGVKHQIKDNKLTEKLTNIAKCYGLTDVKIHIGEKFSYYDLYNITVDCSNLESLSYAQMYSLADSMNVDNAFVCGFTSQGDSYLIYPYTKSIYKNGVEIHDDYYNSDSYKNAITIKNKKDKYSYNSSANAKSLTSSAKSYRSYTKSKSSAKSDPYNTKNYSNEEDFYYDHYDDFFDYYDAEEYYKEHN